MRRRTLTGLVLLGLGLAPLAAQSPAPTGTPAPAPALGAQTHPWSVTPQHNEWMVCVKSFTGPNAMKESEELAQFVRTQYNAAAYLYEWGAEERDRQLKVREEIIAQERQRMAPFLESQAQLKLEAERKGLTFIPTKPTVRVPKVTAQTQWAVVVGGWKTMDEAAGALKQIREWKQLPPTHLMERMTVALPGEGGRGTAEGQYVNPFKTALVVANPSIRRAKEQVAAIDPLIVKLNENEPLSVLRCPKAWTLIVKDFQTPTVVQTQGQEGNVIGKVFGDDSTTEAGRLLERTAITARELATTLRTPEMQKAFDQAGAKLNLPPALLEAYVLHLPTGSRVTIGQFDSLDDPALQNAMQLLSTMSFQVRNSANGPVVEERRMFDGITPMPIPKHVAPTNAPK